MTDTGWVQVAKAGLTGPTKVEFVGKTGDAEICITGGLAILADQKYDIDVSFTNLKLSKPNPTYGGDYGHSTNSVSYTHLDVYKRQEYKTAPPNSQVSSTCSN